MKNQPTSREYGARLFKRTFDKLPSERVADANKELVRAKYAIDAGYIRFFRNRNLERLSFE